MESKKTNLLKQLAAFIYQLLLLLLLLLLLSFVPSNAFGAQFSAQLSPERDPFQCKDSFDGALKKQCMKGEWEQKYYFDAESRECRLFWYDGCPGLTGSRNFFDSLLECQWLCEPGQTQRNAICLEPFDEHLRDECDGTGNWRRHFYFDRIQRRCLPFWFDGCISPGGNHFEDEISCAQNCESGPPVETSTIEHKRPSIKQTIYVPAWRLISTTLTTPIRTNNYNTIGIRIQQTLGRNWPQLKKPNSLLPISTGTHPTDTPSMPPPSRTFALPTTVKSLPSSSVSSSSPSSMSSSSFPFSSVPIWTINANEQKTICDQNNPCQNGGKCVFNVLINQPICKCASSFTNDFCTERIDFDPCSPNPCKNGATCSALAGTQQTEFDCFCARGFAGRHCEFRPCDENPCQNGGICRTSRSQSLFFCACAPGWGGKTCLIGVSANGKILDLGESLLLENANLTQQLSSGRAEWIEELKRVTPMMPNLNSVGQSPNDDEDRSVINANSNTPWDVIPHQSPIVGLPQSLASSRRSKEKERLGTLVGFPHDQIVGQELPIRTLKGTTAIAAANGAEKRKNCTDRRELINSVLQNILAIICSLLVYPFCF